MDKLKKNYPFLSECIIEDFSLSHSKFNNLTKRHFVAKSDSNNKFFIKAFDLSDKNRLIAEIRSREFFSGLISNMPKIYQTYNYSYYVKIDNIYYIVMDFISEGQCKLPLNELLKLQSVMHKKINNNSLLLLNLEKNNSVFIAKHKRITKLVNKNKGLNKIHRDYLLFCWDEYLSLKEDILKLEIFKRNIHGDFFNINLVKDFKKIWIIDWEKTTESAICNDICRTIIFELFMKNSLNKRNVTKYIKEYFKLKNIRLSKDEKENFIKIFYFLWITNLSFVGRLYEGNVPLKPKMLEEDFEILKFIKNNFI